MKIKDIQESTVAGSIASVAKPLGEIQTRSKPEKAPKVTKGKKYANTISEGAVKQLAYDLIHMDPKEFELVYKKAKEFFQKTPTATPKVSPSTKQGSKAWHDTGYTDKKAAQAADEPIQEDELKEEDLIIMPGMIKNKDKSFVPKHADRRDHEVEMACSDLYATAKDAMRILKILKNRSEDEGIMGWQQSYITLAADYLNSVADSLEYDSVSNEGTVGKIISAIAKQGAKDLPKTPETQRAIANQAMKIEKGLDKAVKTGTAAVGAAAGKEVYDKAKKTDEGVAEGSLNEFAPDGFFGGGEGGGKGPKAKAKAQMIKAYGSGIITFRKTSNGGYFVQHEDDFGDTNSHQYDPQTGKVDFSGVTRSSYYGEGVADNLEYDARTDEMTGGVLAGGMSNFEEGVVNELSPKTLNTFIDKLSTAVRQGRAEPTKINPLTNKVATPSWKVAAGKVYPNNELGKYAKIKAVDPNQAQVTPEGRYYDPMGDERREQQAMDDERRDFKRREMDAELGHEKNNYAVAIDGRTWKVFGDRQQAENIARSLVRKGKKATVHITGASISEEQAPMFTPESKLEEKKDACYTKVKSRYKVWPSAYASGALSKCRKVGASNWGNKSKK